MVHRARTEFSGVTTGVTNHGNWTHTGHKIRSSGVLHVGEAYVSMRGTFTQHLDQRMARAAVHVTQRGKSYYSAMSKGQTTEPSRGGQTEGAVRTVYRLHTTARSQSSQLPALGIEM